MIINIKTKIIDLTKSLGSYVNSKLKFIPKLLIDLEKENALQVDFEIAKLSQHHNKGNVFYAEANLWLAGKKIRAEYNSEDIYKSIDLVKDTLKREIVKYKDKQSEV